MTRDRFAAVIGDRFAAVIDDHEDDDESGGGGSDDFSSGTTFQVLKNLCKLALAVGLC